VASFFAITVTFTIENIEVIEMMQRQKNDLLSDNVQTSDKELG
jgi:hypothetical protein